MAVPVGGPYGYTTILRDDRFGSSRTDGTITSVAQLNPATTYGVNGTGWDTTMLHWAGSGGANVSMQTDHLLLAPTGNTNPGFIVSHWEALPSFSSNYYIEVRCMTGRGSSAASWPAIWLYSGNSPTSIDNNSEIDIAEQYYDLQFGSVAVGGLYPQYFTTTIHGAGHATTEGPKTTLTTGTDVTTSYNVYGCELTSVSGKVRWNVYFNGTLAQTATSDITWTSSAPAVIIGWNPGTSPYAPAQFKLDYVKIWQGRDKPKAGAFVSGGFYGAQT